MELTLTVRVPRWIFTPWARRARAMVLLATLVVGVPVVLASDRFADVPGTHPHHDDINRIALAGVTIGCGADVSTPIYCPEQFVTRGQMASFMTRGFGVIAHGRFEGAVLTSSDPSHTFTFGITPGLPAGLLSGARGYIAVEASLSIVNGSSTSCVVSVTPGIDQGTFQTEGSAVLLPAGAGQAVSVSAHGSAMVEAAGAREIRVTVAMGETPCTSIAVGGDAIATYHPFGSQQFVPGN